MQLVPTPKDQRSFLGLLHYYGKFMPDLAYLHPLNALLQADVKWKWFVECNRAFWSKCGSSLINFYTASIASYSKWNVNPIKGT